MRHEQVSILSVDKQDWTKTATKFADYNFEQASEYASTMARRAGASVLFSRSATASDSWGLPAFD